MELKRKVESGIDEGRYTKDFALFVSESVKPVVDDVITRDRTRGPIAQVAHKLFFGERRDSNRIAIAENRGEEIAEQQFSGLEAQFAAEALLIYREITKSKNSTNRRKVGAKLAFNDPSRGRVTLKF